MAKELEEKKARETAQRKESTAVNAAITEQPSTDPAVTEVELAAAQSELAEKQAAEQAALEEQDFTAALSLPDSEFPDSAELDESADDENESETDFEPEEEIEGADAKHPKHRGGRHRRKAPPYGPEFCIDDPRVNERYKNTVQYFSMDVVDLLAPESQFRKTWKQKVTSIYGDLPYGIGLPNFVIDPKWDEGTVRSISVGCYDLAHPDHCVVMLGAGSARQGVQWADSLQSTGFTVEKHLRMVVDTNAHARAKRAKSKQSMLLTHHFIVVAYTGKLKVNHMGFGFLKKGQKNGYVMKSMPVCPPMYRLVDDQGCIIRTFEKHICEVIELLWTLYGPQNAANGVFLDFCCGTAVSGMAALRANFKTILLNDRDASVQPFAESRMRAYLKHLLGGRSGSHAWPQLGLELHDKHNLRWDGLDPYSFLRFYIKQDRKGTTLVPFKNTPANWAAMKDAYLELHNLKIAESIVIPGQQALFLRKGQTLAKDAEIVCFGDYTRRASGDNERVRTVQLVRHGGDEKALYLRIDRKCPGLFANDPAFSATTKDIPSDGVILEFQERDYGDPARVCIVIGKDITAEEEDREIWITYNLAHVNDEKTGGKQRTVGRTSMCRPLTRSQSTSAMSVAGPDVSHALQVDDAEYEDVPEQSENDDEEERS